MNPFETVANEIDREFLNNTGSQEFAFEFVKGSKPVRRPFRRPETTSAENWKRWQRKK